VTGLPAIAFAVALAWSTLLLIVGGVVLLRARDVFQRIVALDLLATLVVSILALLSYLQDVSYYMDAAVALALLSFVSTVAAARYLGSGGPFT
jgi:multicomponent Na+:H+ antiporter subunit F